MYRRRLIGKRATRGASRMAFPLFTVTTARVFVDDVRNSREVGPYAVGVGADESVEDQ